MKHVFLPDRHIIFAALISNNILLSKEDSDILLSEKWWQL